MEHIHYYIHSQIPKDTKRLQKKRCFREQRKIIGVDDRPLSIPSLLFTGQTDTITKTEYISRKNLSCYRTFFWRIFDRVNRVR